ncbi:methanogenesis marker 16 metalloprotein [Methanosalsum natronophilum]|uniref:methanogenesis marker 16 metalloprotein n=1 Tax=Methanosalsum natronophilum TaxID=768733 RepID=UPI00216A5E92|nr:methanogenesis marker 16 metalloprotein [Methanosalsum natronophilum]MCS3923624.1 putative methanogenesis marker 16 metalloprotein [Methanosalsum natronophilum]
MNKSFQTINEKLKNNEAVVLTANEVKDLVKKGENVQLKDIDVITTATRAIMSGTYAVMSFPIDTPISFRKALKVTMNGVPAYVGPCPNESLGVIDIMIFGTVHSIENKQYGAGHLFRDLVEGKDIQVSITTDTNYSFNTNIKLQDIPYAKLYSTRHAFKNYAAFVNCSNTPVSSIFHTTQFEPNMKASTLSGCGSINPLQNDPLMDTIGIGTRVLINGAEGFIIGDGTRSTPEKPNLACVADIHHMNPALMGGFKTSAGPECIASWGIAIPVITTSVLDAILKTDSDIPMVINDVHDRIMISSSTYADAWTDTDLTVQFCPDECTDCNECEPINECPMKAIYYKNSKLSLDRYLCFNCGLCSTLCENDVFIANLGQVNFEMDGNQHNVPIVLRQSDRKRAEKIAQDLKYQVIKGNFKLSHMVEKIYDP